MTTPSGRHFRVMKRRPELEVIPVLSTMEWISISGMRLVHRRRGNTIHRREMASDSESSRWLDISIPLRNAMVYWPGDPPVRIENVKDMEHGASSTLLMILMGSHTGTHMDAPLHFIRQGLGIDKMPLDTTVGRARVIEIHDSESIKPEELYQYRIRSGERILFKTRNSLRVWQTDTFIEDFVSISKEAARFLVEHKVRVIGVVVQFECGIIKK